MMGCFVTGHITDAAGQPMRNRRVSITPDRSSLDAAKNTLYTAEEVRTKTLDNGMWKVELLPGLYTVKALGETVQMLVPDARKCTFADAVMLAEDK